MAGPIDVSVEINENLTEALGNVAAFAGDLSPAMKEIAVYLERIHKGRFETETGPDGKRWKPSQRVIDHGGKTLTLSTDLSSSVHAIHGPRSAEVGPERSFGAAIYAAIHQFGGIIRPKAKKALSFGGRILALVRMPARPYVGFGAGDQDAIADILRAHLRTALSGSAPS